MSIKYQVVREKRGVNISSESKFSSGRRSAGDYPVGQECCATENENSSGDGRMGDQRVGQCRFSRHPAYDPQTLLDKIMKGTGATRCGYGKTGCRKDHYDQRVGYTQGIGFM